MYQHTQHNRPGEFLWTCVWAGPDTEEGPQHIPDHRMKISYLLNPENKTPLSFFFQNNSHCIRPATPTSTSAPSSFQQLVLELVMLEGIPRLPRDDHDSVKVQKPSLKIQSNKGRPRRHRASPLQRRILERSYASHHNPTPKDRAFLASLIGLSERQVTTWYLMSSILL